MTSATETSGRTASLPWIVVLTGIGSMMAALDTLVVSTALTTIHRTLHASIGQLEWTVNGYNLSFAVLLITGAALGDRFGRRRLYAAGLGLFALASAGSALAPTVSWLVAARVLQGAGAALIVPIGLTLLSAAFPPERRGAAIGMFSAVTGVSVAAGPLVGGAVVQGLAWQWIFWLNVPIGVAAALLVLRRLPETFGPNTALDIRGLLLISGGALGLVWALVRGNSAGWTSAEVVSALGGRRPTCRRLRRLGRAGALADAPAEPVPLAGFLGRQRRHFLHDGELVRRGFLRRPAAAVRARVWAAGRGAPSFTLDSDIHHRGPDRRRPG